VTNRSVFLKFLYSIAHYLAAFLPHPAALKDLFMAARLKTNRIYTLGLLFVSLLLHFTPQGRESGTLFGF
jgi:hypothetical protein